MNRNLAVFAGVAGGLLAGWYLARTIAARHVTAGPAVAMVDFDAPASAGKSDVLAKCTKTEFVETASSDPYTVATNVVVRVIPAKGSHRFKMSQLEKGRIIAKVRNEGTAAYPALALLPRGESCWFVWYDDARLQVVSKFIATEGGAEAEDDNFHIDIHPTTHPAEKGEWKKPADVATLTPPGLFHLAGFQPAGEDSTGGGPYMWTTCLTNGCCRTRQ